MENLEPYKIDKLNVNFQRKGDLLYHEGPLLSHFINSENPSEHYFYKWSDCNDQHNRWLIFRISIENLNIFFDGKLTLLELIQKNDSVFFWDLDTDLTTVNTFVCPTQKIPSDYLPSDRSFFKESQYEPYAFILKKELKKDTEHLKEIEIVLLFKEILAIKNDQLRQDRLLNSLINQLRQDRLLNLINAKGEQVSEIDINYSIKDISINSFNSLTKINQAPKSAIYEPI
jgi:hypothetical protein